MSLIIIYSLIFFIYFRLSVGLLFEFIEIIVENISITYKKLNK